MQTTKLNLTNNLSVHFKVVLNNEFRRFSLEKLSFTLLEQTIRAVYSLPEDNILKICFVDDEKDLVLMSTDDEMAYALELTDQPVRLSVTIVNGSAESFASSAPCRGRSGWGRGRGREEWKEERLKWKEERQKLSPSERLDRKSERISAWIEHVESVLQTEDIPANRQRCLNWRLEKLNSKLEKIKEKQTLISNAESKTPCHPFSEIPTEQQIRENEQVPLHGSKGKRGGWGGSGCSRGRGGPGCSRGSWGGPHGYHCSRGGFGPHGGPHCARGPCTETEASTETVPYDRERIWENFHTCHVNLNAARKSGNQEEIEKCFQALREAKEKKRETKGMKKAGKKCFFLEEKAAKCSCFKNLREARLSGDPEKIKQCEEALAVAKQTLKAAKVEYFLNKQ